MRPLLQVRILFFASTLFFFASQPSLFSSQPPLPTAEPPLRLNQIQVVGTHNSYHLEPPPAVIAIGESPPFRQTLPFALSAATDYSHRSLAEQLGRQRVRQLELDLYPDPDGVLFREPLGAALAILRGEKIPLDAPTAAALAKPGFKVLHKPEFDYRSNTPTFVTALSELREWSRKNPGHVPVLVLIELKSHRVASPDTRALSDPTERELVAGLRSGPEWSDKLLAALEDEILSVFPLDQILTPSRVQGDAPTLRDAVLTRGWPALDAVRGHVFFALDNENAVRDRYLALSQQSGRPRLLFVSVPPDHPEAAWMKINDPLRDFAVIQERVRAGFLVRTRADEELREAKTNDTTRRERAFASGAHFVSTDFPEPNLRYSDYSVRISGDTDFAPNSVSAPVKASSTPTPNR